MPEITIRLHPDLADRLLAAGRRAGAVEPVAAGGAGGRLARAPIAYAPAVLPDGIGCAMSVHLGLSGMVLEVDRPGTPIPGRDVVAERPAEPRRAEVTSRARALALARILLREAGKGGA